MSRLIDADALIDKYGEWYTEEGTEEGYIGTVKGIVDSIPTIESETEEEAYERGYTAGQMAQRKTGTWILIRIEENGNGLYECSECHKGEIHVPIVEVKYCWNCGTKMEEPEDIPMEYFESGGR